MQCFTYKLECLRHNYKMLLQNKQIYSNLCIWWPLRGYNSLKKKTFFRQPSKMERLKYYPYRKYKFHHIPRELGRLALKLFWEIKTLPNKQRTYFWGTYWPLRDNNSVMAIRICILILFLKAGYVTIYFRFNNESIQPDVTQLLHLK